MKIPDLRDSRPAHLIFILAFILLAYSNTFDVPFQFDDGLNIVENKYVKDLSHFADPFNSGESFMLFQTRYLGFLSMALNYRFNGLDVTGYHVVNTAVHMLSAAVAYFLVRLLLRTPALRESAMAAHSGLFALLSALVFSLHPLQTESVTYIVQRLASMAAMFYMSSIAFYLRYRLIGGRKWYGLSLLAAIMAMFTKEFSITLPAVIMLTEVSFFTGKARERITRLIPYGLLFLVIPTTMFLTKFIGTGGSAEIAGKLNLQATATRTEYLLTQFGVITLYLRLLLLPYGQNLDYDLPIYSSFGEPNVFLPFIFLAAIFLGASYMLYQSIRGRQGWGPEAKLAGFGVLWFFMTISVESSIIPIRDVIFEHRVYMPMLGILLSVAAGISVLVKKLPDQKAAHTLMVLCLIAALVYTPLTYRRNTVWASSFSLWRDVLKHSPDKARPHLNLCKAYMDEEDFSPALDECRRALELDPEMPEAYNNMAMVYDKLEVKDAAISIFKAGLAKFPNSHSMHSMLGRIYGRRGDMDKALEHLGKAVMLDPDNSVTLNNYGMVMYMSGNIQAALESFRRSVRLDDGNIEAHYNLSMVLKKLGHHMESDAHLRTYNRLKAETH